MVIYEEGDDEDWNIPNIAFHGILRLFLPKGRKLLNGRKATLCMHRLKLLILENLDEISDAKFQYNMNNTQILSKNTEITCTQIENILLRKYVLAPKRFTIS